MKSDSDNNLQERELQKLQHWGLVIMYDIQDLWTDARKPSEERLGSKLKHPQTGFRAGQRKTGYSWVLTLLRKLQLQIETLHLDTTDLEKVFDGPKRKICNTLKQYSINSTTLQAIQTLFRNKNIQNNWRRSEARQYF